MESGLISGRCVRCKLGHTYRECCMHLELRVIYLPLYRVGGNWRSPEWLTSGFGGLGVACCLLSTQVRGFKPGRSRQDFSGRKNPQHAFLRRGSKAVGPMSQICGM